jgi:hypothetical protein
MQLVADLIVLAGFSSRRRASSISSLAAQGDHALAQPFQRQRQESRRE